MQTSFHTVDYAIVVAYFIILLGFGLYLRKRASSSLDDYFLGGRKLPWWALGVSGTATWVNISGTMIIVSFLYMLGPRGLFIEFRGGACLILVVALLWSGKWHRRSGCMTGAEWVIFRFGNTLGAKIARIASAFGAMLATIAMLALLIKGVGLFFSMFVPYTPSQCAFVMVLIATFYTMLAGFYGVVYTDIFQSIVILIVVVAISIMGFLKVQDAASLAAVAENVTGSTEWLTSYPQWKTSLPAGGEYSQYQYLLLFAFFYLVRNLLGGTGAGAAPHYFGARSDRECGLIAFLWGHLIMLRWPLMMGFAVLGLYLINDLFTDPTVLAQTADIIKHHLGPLDKSQWAETIARLAQHPQQYSTELIGALRSTLGPDWTTAIHLVGYEGSVDPERIMPAVILYCIPAGLTGLMLVTLIAAFMSTFDSSVNIATAFFTRDLYQAFFRPTARNRELIGASWLFCIAIVLLGFVMAYYTKSINDIWGWLVMGLGSGGIVPALLMFYWWRFSGGALAFSGLFGGFAAILQRLLWPYAVQAWGWPILNEWQLFLFMLAIGLISSLIGIRLFPLKDTSALENFYRKVRPFGFWGSFPQILTPQQRQSMRREHRNDLIALPFALLWIVTLFLWPMQVIIHDWRACSITVGLFILSLAGMYRFWYRNLPPQG